ncbi:MAG: hypothetical protein ACHQNT_04110 [Bacteroidia bacterium]
MKKHLKEKVDAMTAFKNFCDQNQIVWSAVVAFATAIAALGVKIQSIFTTESQQEENNKGVTRTKGQKKTDMANEAVAVAEGLQAFAIDSGNEQLYDSMGIAFTTIMKAKDPGAISKCQLVFDTASGIPIIDLQPYGISATVLNTLDTAIEDFTAASPTTRNVETHKTVLTNNLTKLVSEGNTIMRKQLLKIGRQFKITNPDFYEGLVANAKVITNSVHAKIRIMAVTGDPAFAVEGATVTISGTDLKGVTDAKGKCTITKVPAGERVVTVVKDTMRTQLTVNFQRGHSITRTVELKTVFDVPEVTAAKKEKVK